MNQYRVLGKNIVTRGRFSLVPIRSKDRVSIMNWRNEQIYHLRQNSFLTLADQDNYFENVVSKLFNQDKPSQILFSLLEDDICIGYGGLVHINWIDLNAELSFIMDTAKEKINFESVWDSYLDLIEEVAFNDIHLHKIYTYAFDLRPHLYTILEKNGFFLDARLKEHCLFKDEFIDVVLHSKIRL